MSDKPSFFCDVHLPAFDLRVTIRKVDAKAITDASTVAVFTQAHAQVGMDHARGAGEFLKRVMASDGAGARTEVSEEETPEIVGLLMEVTAQSYRDMVQEALVTPDLDELLTLYRAKHTHSTFGMGPDFMVLVNAIREHSGVKTVTLKEGVAARRFPDDERGDAGRDGETVRPGASGTVGDEGGESGSP